MKTTTLTIRISPQIKNILEQLSIIEHRSMSNMIEVLILDRCHSEESRDPRIKDLIDQYYSSI